MLISHHYDGSTMQTSKGTCTKEVEKPFVIESQANKTLVTRFETPRESWPTWLQRKNKEQKKHHQKILGGPVPNVDYGMQAMVPCKLWFACWLLECWQGTYAFLSVH